MRLDVLLVQRGLAESRQKAQAMILAGEIEVDGKKTEKAGANVSDSSRIDVHSRLQKYVSRGGFKLEGALEDFRVNPQGKICLDVGSSTGGFTDCLLQNGAIRVYAVDVNVDQLAWKLHEDVRVVRIKKNARELTAGRFTGEGRPRCRRCLLHFRQKGPPRRSSLRQKQTPTCSS